jgi:excinuclease ABC subunit B
MEHARNLEFEQAAATRDQLGRLRAMTFGASSPDKV